MTEPRPSPSPNLDRWYSFRLDEQAVGALGLLAELLPHAVRDPYLWKWAVIATHDALHGFKGLALRPVGSGAQMRVPKHEQRAYALVERERHEGRPIPEDTGDRVDQFLGLFEKLQVDWRMRPYMNSEVFVPTAEQDSAVRYLDRLRNDLTHYSNTTLPVQVGDLPNVLLCCIGVVEWLLVESGNVTIFEQESEDTARRRIQRIKDELASLAAHWPATDRQTCGV
jgi:hypothetical protein